MANNSKQMVTGKSFEYALLEQFYEKLKSKTNIQVVEDSSYIIAKDCFNSLSKTEKISYLVSASAAVNFLIDTEPRLSNDDGEKDFLQLQILSDNYGKIGDVRDVLITRPFQKWEIGVSAKNNHEAVKHSRLSSHIDFGEKWIGVKSSDKYFKAITPIFDNLERIKNESNGKKKWSELGNYHLDIYLPVLEAFLEELKRIDKAYPSKAAANLVSYLVGNKDFHKVVKGKNKVEVTAYNLNGTLNLPFKKTLPKHKAPIVPLPTKIVDISFKEKSDTTVIVKMDNDWTLSFRIHNASSRVESSLKFDIHLLKAPKKLFKKTLIV